MQLDADHALAHLETDDVLRVVPFRNIDAVGPAGSINSSAREMAEWMRLLLARGALPSGERLLDGASVRNLFETVIPIPGAGETFDEEGPAGYALGWMVQDYRGKQRVHHGGGIDGFSAMVTLFPSEELGITALSNASGSPLPNVLTLWIADRVLGLEPIDWNARLRTITDAAEAAEDSKEDEG